jgi:DNA-binding NtrC family response regulator
MTHALDGNTVLIADDEPSIRDLLHDILAPHGMRVLVASSGSEAVQFLEAETPDLAILDVRMPDPGGLAILKQLREQGNDIPVVIITAFSSSTVTIEAMQSGAYDSLVKPFEPDDVLLVVGRALEHRYLTRRVRSLEQKIGNRDPRDIIIGQSPAMQEIYKLIGRVSGSDTTVLITGESGTGKELVARTIHRTSPRGEEPFITINCAALPETLLESELFGHEKGAFTGAMARRQGRFEQANKGTIFLDEIGEMSPATQKKLLRVLQERSFERVGGNVTVKVNVRVLAATNRDLERAVASGAFREDLYYRLNVINIHMPPLRERRDDIPPLIEHFLARRRHREGSTPARIAYEALDRLVEYDWPGNVRQLENTIERSVVLSQDGLITLHHISLPTGEREQYPLLNTALNELLRKGYHMHEIQDIVYREAIQAALQYHEGDRAATARALRIERSQIDQET